METQEKKLKIPGKSQKWIQNANNDDKEKKCHENRKKFQHK